MHRCETLVSALGSAVDASRVLPDGSQTAETKGVVLCCDLAVDPAREAEMTRHFYGVFRPGAAKFRGYRDARMLKLRTLIQGEAAQAVGVRYRFQLAYENEELRQIWLSSPEHQALWPPIENTLIDKQYAVSLFDEA
jgi:hypothetical protein